MKKLDLNELKKRNEVKVNFLKKKGMGEKYEKIRKMLVVGGYTPSSNTTHHYSFDCKKSKESIFSPSEAQYPYSITIKYQKQSAYQIRLAA